jgi:hypothetical protein
LDRACAGNAALRRRIDQLLHAKEEADAYLGDQGQLPAAASLCDNTIGEIAEGSGSVIGRYKLLQQIGEGGFGVVYMAEQSEPVQRRVALKIIKLGMDTKQVIARFEAERQALAMMDHPNIAKVHDAGTTDSGRPYFVMELVKGVPINGYCDKNQLSLKERLELFIPVGQAIQHAHQKGIIHRDIKPSNILVTLHDGVPMPKVIDFGIAKATDHRLTEKTLFTDYAQMLGTPACPAARERSVDELREDWSRMGWTTRAWLYPGLSSDDPDNYQVSYGLNGYLYVGSLEAVSGGPHFPEIKSSFFFRNEADIT